MTWVLRQYGRTAAAIDRTWIQLYISPNCKPRFFILNVRSITKLLEERWNFCISWFTICVHAFMDKYFCFYVHIKKYKKSQTLLFCVTVGHFLSNRLSSPFWLTDYRTLDYLADWALFTDFLADCPASWNMYQAIIEIKGTLNSKHPPYSDDWKGKEKKSVFVRGWDGRGEDWTWLWCEYFGNFKATWASE